MKIYMVRHGQTDLNAKKLINSRIDEPLNEEGKRQARECARALSEIPLDVVFSSPLRRAAETAHILADERNIPVEFRDGFQERDFGTLSGKSYEDAAFVVGQDPRTFKATDHALEYDYRPFGGESAAQVRERFLTCIDEIKSAYADKRVLIVAHSGIVRFAHRLFRGVQVGHMPNAILEEFEV